MVTAELTRVLPYLYPSTEAYDSVVRINKPAPYIAWAEAAGDSAAGARYLTKARDLALAMAADNKDRGDLLGKIGVLYAKRGELSDSRYIAQRTTAAEEQLKICTEILRYDAIHTRPRSKEFLTEGARGN